MKLFAEFLQYILFTINQYKMVAIAIISCLLCSFSFPKIEKTGKIQFFSNNSLQNFLGLENVILFVLVLFKIAHAVKYEASSSGQ